MTQESKSEGIVDKPMSNFLFRFMSLGYMFRDLGHPPEDKVKEASIKPGFCVLDYGCGPGSYTIVAAELAGETGKVYALDIHPLAIQSVHTRASKKGLTNVETIHSDCKTGLADCSIDVVLLYDTFHTLNDPDSVLQELHRVLKENALLSFSDHHMAEDEIVSGITKNGLFRLSKKGERTYTFLKEG